MAGSEAEISRDLAQPQRGNFFRSAVREPLSVGALVPSSRFLANLLVTDMGPGSRVIELGAGTGAVTQAILDAGVHPNDLTLVEQNEDFAGLLTRRFPGTNVVQANAVSLRRYLPANAAPADIVVSGLPLLLFPARAKLRLLSQVFGTLRDGGCLYQFTYGLLCPISRSLRDTLGLDAALVKFTPFNLPPAFVYRLTRSS